MQLRTILFASAVALAIAPAAFAKELVFGSWAPTNHGSNYALEPLFKSVQEKSKGEMT
ncbi:MAG: TRAP-type C4-dicarboxylate transport system, substrate-binding protein, partial [Hyphomicrobiales bacterium]|nr:TRAP-type C4-dicarboxylate transport system, substrate-binding protein [Hyphomicrobiales bacterium]